MTMIEQNSHARLRLIGSRSVVVATALAVVSFARSAAADDGGFEGGLRLGYGVPLGKLSDDNQGTNSNDLSDYVAGIVPVWLDVGYRIDGNFFVGGFFQYGFGWVGDNYNTLCDQNGGLAGLANVSVDCSANSLRLGAQFHYHILPERVADPWIGYGFGYEWASVTNDISSPVGDATVTESVTGFEFANFQVGVDFLPTDHFYLGPFLSFSMDEYDSADANCDGSLCANIAANPDINDKALHYWFLFGIRGGYTGFTR